MAKSSNKTVETDASVADFIQSVEDPVKRADCETIMAMMHEVTGWEPKMWGTSIIGYGRYHYKYESGREGDALRVGLSPRAQNISVYIMPGYEDFSDELQRLGKHKTGKSCLYIKRLSDVDASVLKEIIVKGVDLMAQKYPVT